MKNKIKYFIYIIIIVFIIVIYKIFSKHAIFSQSISLNKNNIKYNIKYKGLKNSRDFTIDDSGNYYIAYKDKIQIIKENGKSYNIFEEEDFDIFSIEYLNNKLYFTSNCEVYSYDIRNKKLTCIINNLPNYGDYRESKLTKYNEYIFISVGTATNSAVVGPDNIWLKYKPHCFDISPKTIILKGVNFGEKKTGAFVPYGTENIKGQIISGCYPGNGSVIIYNINNGARETFAFGIRNIKDMCINEEGKVIAVVGGMENRGLRPVKNDVDYVFQINKDTWYGWPDYSGGDPINSPRFNENNNIDFILDKHPTINPPAPLYQHDKVGSLESLCIDYNNFFGENHIIVYDNKEFKLYSISKNGKEEEVARFINNDNIVSINNYKNKMILLGNKCGYIYELSIK